LGEEEREEEKRGRAGLVDSPCRARRGGAAGPGPRLPRAPLPCHRGTPAAPLHVARQRRLVAPPGMARSKGSPGANNVFQRLILKLI
jgi:hypothetical protein